MYTINMDKQITTSEIMALQDAGIRNLYVRWSRGPECDTVPSRDYVNGGSHVGLSAVLIDFWERDIMVRRIKEYEFLRIKDTGIEAYVYQADPIGIDSDGYASLPIGSKCLGQWVEE